MNLEFCCNPECFYNTLKYLEDTVESLEEIKNTISQMSSYVDELKSKGYSLSMYEDITSYIQNLYSAFTTYKGSVKKLCDTIAEADSLFDYSMDYYNGEISKEDYYYEMAFKSSEYNDDASSALQQEIARCISKNYELKNKYASYDSLIAVAAKEYYDTARMSGYEPDKPESFSNHMPDNVRELYKILKQYEQEKIDCYNEIAALDSKILELQDKLSVIDDKIEADEKEAKKQETKELWNDFFDFDGDGVNCFDEFADALRNCDYHAAYGSQTMYVDGSFFYYDAYTLDLVADYIFAPAVETTGDIVIGTGEVVIDYSMDYVDDPWGAKLRLAATLTNTAIGAVDGAIGYAENIGDTLSLFVKYALNIDPTDVATFISNDYSSMLFDYLYDTVLKPVDEYSYDAGKHEDGMLYSGAQAFGEYIPSLLIGKGVGTTWQAISIGANTMGQSLEEGFQELIENSEDGIVSEKDFGYVYTKSLTDGAISTTVFLVAKKCESMPVLEIAVKSSQPLISATVDYMLFDEEFDTAQVITDTIVVVVSETASKVFESKLEDFVAVDMEGIEATPSEFTEILIGVTIDDAPTPQWIKISGKFTEEEVASIVSEILENGLEGD